MSSLVGKAQEDDDAFWSHSIWSEAGGGYADGRSRKRRRDEEAESSSSGEEEEGSGGGGGGGSGGVDEDGSASDGEGSYRMSDEDSAAAADHFDSDFDESESDDEGGDGEGGEGEEERELHAEERRVAAAKRKKNQRLAGAMALQSSSSAGRGLMRKKTGRVTRRGPLGEGWNEGLVLSWPPPPPPPDGAAGADSAKGPGRPQISDSKSIMVPVAQSLHSIPAVATANQPHIPSHPATHPSADTERIDKETPALSPQYNRPMAATSAPASPSTKTANDKHSSTKLKSQLKQEAISERKKSQRIQFTQEELILESIKFTETENAKWLNARKRSKEEAAQLEKSTGSGSKRSSLNQHLISRFHSRRGCNTTITFMDMDRLPEILTRGQISSSGVHPASYAGTETPTRRRRMGSSSSEASESSHPTLEKKYEKCVITGKVARYRDPRTMFGYHDLDAYKELRRRLDAGKLKISRPAVRKNNGSNNGAVSKGKGATSTKFPFALGQPTMVAEMAPAGPNKVEVRVRVTQGGVPVSPPSGLGLHFNFPSEMRRTAEGKRKNRKEPPPLLPTLPLVGQVGDFGLTAQNIFEEIDLGIDTEHLNGYHAEIDGWNAKNGILIAAAANERTPDLSNSSEYAHQVEHLRVFEAPSDDFEFVPFFTDDGSTHSMGSIEYSSGINADAAIHGAKNDDENVGDTDPRLALLGSTPETTTSTLLASNDQLKKSKHFESNEGIAPPPHAIKINARKSADGDNGGIPMEVTKSNDKRTTIEAN